LNNVQGDVLRLVVSFCIHHNQQQQLQQQQQQQQQQQPLPTHQYSSGGGGGGGLNDYSALESATSLSTATTIGNYMTNTSTTNTSASPSPVSSPAFATARPDTAWLTRDSPIASPNASAAPSSSPSATLASLAALSNPNTTLTLSAWDTAFCNVPLPLLYALILVCRSITPTDIQLELSSNDLTATTIDRCQSTRLQTIWTFDYCWK
jgi:hypothetical protein